MLVLQSAGNLATTQSVISLLSARIRTQQEPNLMQVTSLYDAAMLIGKTLLEVIQRDSSNQQTCSNTNFNCNLLLGGQIAGETHRLFHIYPEGNFIEATRDTPYFQIGESKYGKPIIDRVLTIDTPLEQAMCCALISIDSTLRSNLSVGLPLDTLLYRSGSQQCRAASHHRQRSYFNRIRKAWSEGLLHTFQTLPTGRQRSGKRSSRCDAPPVSSARRRVRRWSPVSSTGGKVSVVLRPTTASFSNSGKN